MPDATRRRLLELSALSLTALAGGCAMPQGPHHGPHGASQWHEVPLPGKRPTRYHAAAKEGRRAWAAHADRSASMWRRRVEVDPSRLGDVRFSWWVQDLIANASVADVDREDAPARVLFGFSGDHARLPARARMMFDLAEALTGERPPFATLMYVWDAEAALESVIHNPRTDRIRKIVVDSGTAQLRRWRDHRRNLVRDYRLAFGEDPGRLISIALMTDADNTRSSATSWYGPVELL